MLGMNIICTFVKANAALRLCSFRCEAFYLPPNAGNDVITFCNTNPFTTRQTISNKRQTCHLFLDGIVFDNYHLISLPAAVVLLARPVGGPCSSAQMLSLLPEWISSPSGLTGGRIC